VHSSSNITGMIKYRSMTCAQQVAYMGEKCIQASTDNWKKPL